MKHNVIPRKATELAVTFNKDTPGNKAGDVTIVKKNEFGYWSDGKYCYFVEHLRNPEFCKLDVIS